MNTLASLRYRLEFGRDAVYTLQTAEQKSSSEKHKAAAEHRGNILFDEDVTYSMLASLLSQNAEIRSTPLTENFELEDYKKKYGKKAIPLFALDTKERLRIFEANDKITPGAGWTLISLIQNDVEKEDGKNNKTQE